MKPTTDKYISGLAEYYKKEFSSFCNNFENPIHVLEIGVDKGGGLFLYEEILKGLSPKVYFYLYGIDIKQPDTIPDNTIFQIINQTDSKSLNNFGKSIGNFDIIIDDGCHYGVETQNCLNIFWKYLNKNGIYYIEDWGACFEPAYCGRFSSMKLFAKNIIDCLEDIKVSNMNIIYNPSPSFSVIKLQK